MKSSRRAWNVCRTIRTRSPRRHSGRQPSQNSFQRSSVELLEDRRLLAVITVDSLADNTTADGSITLREAILAANSDAIADAVEGSQSGAGPDTIRFAAGLVSGGDASIDLSLIGDVSMGASAFSVTSPITISGPAGDNGISIIRDVGAADMRLFVVQVGGSLEIERVTLADGVAAGAAGEDGLGGAILNMGALGVHESTLRDNAARGGDNGAAAGGDGLGGAIFNHAGQVLITNSTISGNEAIGGSGTPDGLGRGGGLLNRNGTVEITNSTISDNTAADGGGGVYNLGERAVLLDQASDFPVAGGIGVFASQNDTNTVDGLGNFATSYEDFAFSEGAKITRLEWQGGYFTPAAQGTIERFTITVWSDVAGEPGLALLTNVIEGTAGETPVGVEPGIGDDGNLIFDYHAELPVPFQASGATTYWISIVPDLFFEQDDLAPVQPGAWGWHTSLAVGSIVQDFDVNFNGSFELPGERFSEPFSLALSLLDFLPATVTMTNTIVANSTGGATDFENAAVGGGIATTSGDTNIIESNAGFVGVNTIASDPLLASLGDNGGPTNTHLPLTGSLAIDAGTASGAPMIDQRGALRPADGDGDFSILFDIGAVELAPPPVTADLSVTKTDGLDSVAPGALVTYTIVVSNAGPDAVGGVGVEDIVPGGLTGVSWTSVAVGGATSTPGPIAGSIMDTVNLPAGSSVTYTVSGTVSFGFVGSLVNTATLISPVNLTDPDTDNNEATDVTAVDFHCDPGTFGFVHDGTQMFFQVVLTDGDDSLILSTDPLDGDTDYIHVDELGNVMIGSVSAGEIGIAQVLFGGMPYAGVRVKALDGSDLVDATALTGDRVTVLGGRGDDIIFGSPNDDSLNGGGNNDTILGGDGDDTLKGSGGNDYLDGQEGADRIFGGSGDDVVIADASDAKLRGNGGIDRIDFSTSAAGSGFVMHDRTLDGVSFLNRDFERVVGSAFDDFIDNSVFAGSDLLRVWARGGDDIITATSGADFIDGQAGSDFVSYENADSGVNVDLNLTIQADPGSFADDDELRSIENLKGSDFDDVLTGDGADNILKGMDGRDDLFGMAGNDILLGGLRGDRLFGGLGDDRLDGEAGRDRLYGEVGVDTIVADWEQLTGANPDIEVFASGEVDIWEYHNVLDLLGAPLLDRVNELDDFFNDLGNDNKSDFDEGNDITVYGS